ncbi:peptidase S9 [Caulobacter sp. Root1455]|uniref:alpha/beta hydrolase family protein n=1 Tax=Caulobacter sp. Root1455 TaxID=1736465 RepID=UPI0006F6C472|nr:S9 family peptidase [Caulobacter sp. Root1455]KQY95427.1 peptidase S9 [Caulobacter sp. Root1455]
MAAAVCASSGSASAEGPPLSVYGGLPNLEEVEISPDGGKLAIIVTNGEERSVMVRDAAEGGKVITVLRVGQTKLRDIKWAGSDHLLVTASATTMVFALSGPKREYWKTFDYDIVTKKQTFLMKDAPGTMNVVLTPPTVRFIDGTPHAFVEGVYFVDRMGRNTLYRINLKTGATKMASASGLEGTDSWLVSPEGEPLAQSVYDEEKGAWSLMLKSGGTWSTVEKSASRTGSLGLEGLGRDGHSALVWMRDPKDEDQLVLREFSPQGGSTEVPQGGAFDQLVHAPGDGALLGGYALVGDERRYTFFDPKDQANWDALRATIPDEQPILASWSDDRRKIVVFVDSAALGPAYALYDADAGTLRWLGGTYVGLTLDGISEVQSIKYKAADGLVISGYLTLPKDREAKNLPLVVLPHGGPMVRDTLGFDWWSQALASRGYAVLQPNFRGSDGFGPDFIRAGYGQWGKAMQTDLSAGVRGLARGGIIDPKRVCIVGASYGGYAALAGATLDQGVYRCAASVAGPSDLPRMLIDNNHLQDSTNNSTLRYWLRFMNADGVKDPDLAAISPARLADKVAIPVLLIHGKDDTVVPYVQSTLMADALKKAGKPVELVTLTGEDHWLSRGATRQQMLNAVVGFLEKNNPPN